MLKYLCALVIVCLVLNEAMAGKKRKICCNGPNESYSEKKKIGGAIWQNQLRSVANMWGSLFGVCFAFSLCTAYSVREPLRCRPDEELACVRPCPPEKTCRNRGVQFNCLLKGQCEQKCVCKEGYFRNPLGECITEKECDMCPGKNEFFSCGPECDNVCSELHIQNRTNCPIVNIQCNRKCYCEDGYARDAKNECVPVEKCPKRICQNKREIGKESKHICGPNEEYTTCKSICPPETCNSIAAKFRCLENEPCKPRCTCISGYLRLKNGAPCLPAHKCPQLASIDF